MTPDHLLTFLLAHFLLSLAGAGYFWFRRRPGGAAGFLLVGAALVGLIGSFVVARIARPGMNPLLSTLDLLKEISRLHVLAGCLGAATSISWLAAISRLGEASAARGLWLGALFLGGVEGLVFVSAGALAAKESLSKILPNPNAGAGSGGILWKCEPGFRVEKIAQTEIYPIRVAVDEAGVVYITGQSGVAAQAGGVVRLDLDPATGRYVEKPVANMLNRPFGLAARNGDLFVSRSGQLTRAKQGILTHEKTGAVTRLRDLDKDGVFEYYDDVITDLPGSRGSDYLHQNSGIAFGPDGSLYVTTGMNSDRDPPTDDLEGVILKASPDFSKVEVFARGFRNPFGLAVGPGGNLFCTDNDVNADPGDELNHVIKGHHYGHPYVRSGEPNAGRGFTAPIFLSKIALAGLTLATSSQLPASYRDRLYVVGYGAGAIQRIELTPDGETYKAQLFAFANIQGAVDIAASPTGDFYVVCNETREVYRISPVSEQRM